MEIPLISAKNHPGSFAPPPLILESVVTLRGEVHCLQANSSITILASEANQFSAFRAKICAKQQRVTERLHTLLLHKSFSPYKSTNKEQKRATVTNGSRTPKQTLWSFIPV